VSSSHPPQTEKRKGNGKIRSPVLHWHRKWENSQLYQLLPVLFIARAYNQRVYQYTHKPHAMHKCVFFFLINSGSSQQINIATGPKREVPGVPDAFSASSSHGALPPLPSSMSDVYRGRDLKKQLGGSRFPVNLKLHNTDSQYTVNLKNTRFWKTAVTSLHRKKNIY